MGLRVVVQRFTDDYVRDEDGEERETIFTNDLAIYGFNPTQEHLLDWWIKTACEDFKAGAPKVDEYGAHDLEIMGAVLMVLVYRERLDILRQGQTEAKLPVMTELACWFYVLGKVARLVSDYLAKRPGKADTWHDITFYSMMARRIQETGQWP